MRTDLEGIQFKYTGKLYLSKRGLLEQVYISSDGLCGRKMELVSGKPLDVAYMICHGTDYHICVDMTPLPECTACLANMCEKLLTARPRLLEEYLADGKVPKKTSSD